jgi:hypothetical protein
VSRPRRRTLFDKSRQRFRRRRRPVGSALGVRPYRVKIARRRSKSCETGVAGRQTALLPRRGDERSEETILSGVPNNKGALSEGLCHCGCRAELKN